MTNVTHNLSQIESGDPNAAERLLPLVCDELRRLAAAAAIRRILVKRARQKQSKKRGGDFPRLDLDAVEPVVLPIACDVILGVSVTTAYNDWTYARCWLGLVVAGPENS